MSTDPTPEAPAIPGVTRWRGKRPVVVEAIRWDGANLDAIRAFAGDDGTSCTADGDLAVWNNRDRDWKPVPSGHWVVRGPLGALSEDFFPLPPDVFASFYEPAGEPLSDAQCDRLRQITTQWGEAVTAVKVALGYAAQPHVAPAEITAAAWDGLAMLEGSEEEQASG